jgi:hypothetical protein
MNIEKVNHWVGLFTNIGVVVGVLLLVIEINQNSTLMRAEMHAMRAEAKATRQIEQANSGEMIRILYTAYSAGFPDNPDGLDALSGEDQYRFAAFVSGVNEVVQNWHFQCQQGLLDVEICGAGYESMVRSLLGMSKGLGLDFSNNRPSFVADVRRIGKKAGMPVPDEDGTWPQ